MLDRGGVISVESPHQKETGAYYTPASVVDFLTRWAVEHPDAAVLDPSCGDGRFLAGLSGGVGIDVDQEAVDSARGQPGRPQIVRAEFFDWASKTRARFDAAIGNPPFIRYQRFNGDVRKRALDYCADQGVYLSRLSSSWAFFLVAAASLLRPGGRMAFVVPAEIGYAVYARPVLKYLVSAFRQVEVLAIRRKLFPELSVDCWLLCARGHGESAPGIELRKSEYFAGALTSWTSESIDIGELDACDWRLRPFLAGKDALKTYHSLRRASGVCSLGQIAKLGIGYVTGANDFFHLTPSDANAHGIPPNLLKVTVRSNRDLPEKDVSQRTVQGWLEADRPVLLLDLNDVDELPAEVAAYLETPGGWRARASYKCRTRQPWYRVPDVHVPDAFLSIMASSSPRLVRNPAGCVCTNSVHAVTFLDKRITKQAVRRWDTPLTRFSAEVEGHSLGGGMLKLEPLEARRVLVALSKELTDQESRFLTEATQQLRHWRHQDGSGSS